MTVSAEVSLVSPRRYEVPPPFIRLLISFHILGRQLTVYPSIFFYRDQIHQAPQKTRRYARERERERDRVRVSVSSTETNYNQTRHKRHAGTPAKYLPTAP